jgi:hypothetical protein
MILNPRAVNLGAPRPSGAYRISAQVKTESPARLGIRNAKTT